MQHSYDDIIYTQSIKIISFNEFLIANALLLQRNEHKFGVICI